MAGLFLFSFFTLILFVTSTKRVSYDGEGCDKLKMIIANEECPSIGLFSAPGDCTIFYKCLKDNITMPYREYCAMGYIFNGTDCVLNLNKTECPQFRCIPNNVEKVSASFLTGVNNGVNQDDFNYKPVVIPYGHSSSTENTNGSLSTNMISRATTTDSINHNESENNSVIETTTVSERLEMPQEKSYTYNKSVANGLKFILHSVTLSTVYSIAYFVVS